LLRMYERVPVDLAGGGEHEACSLGLGETQSVVGTQSADLQDRDRDTLDDCRACRGGEVVDLIHPAWVLYIRAHVVVYVLKTPIVLLKEVSDVL